VALPIALVVGTVLLAVNQGSALAAGQVDVATALRALANYAIPYVVSSVGYLNRPDDQPSGLDRADPRRRSRLRRRSRTTWRRRRG